MSATSDYMDVMARLYAEKGQALGQAALQKGQIWGQTISNIGQQLPGTIAQVDTAIKTGQIQSAIRDAGGDLQKALPRIMQIDPGMGSAVTEHLLSAQKLQTEFQNEQMKLKEAQYNYNQNILNKAYNAFASVKDQATYGATLHGIQMAGGDVSDAPTDYETPEAKNYIEFIKDKLRTQAERDAQNKPMDVPSGGKLVVRDPTAPGGYRTVAENPKEATNLVELYDQLSKTTDPDEKARLQGLIDKYTTAQQDLAKARQAPHAPVIMMRSIDPETGQPVPPHPVVVDDKYTYAQGDVQQMTPYQQQNLNLRGQEVAQGAQRITQSGARLDLQKQREEAMTHPIIPKEGDPDYKIAIDLSTGDLSSADFNRLMGTRSGEITARKEGIYLAARELNPNFSPAVFEIEQKMAGNVALNRQIVNINRALPIITRIKQLAEQAGNVDIKTFNQMLNAAKIQVGNQTISDMRQLQLILGDEVGAALGSGTGTNQKTALGLLAVDPNQSLGAFLSNMNQLEGILNNSRNELLRPMGIYGPKTGQEPKPGLESVDLPAAPGAKPGTPPPPKTPELKITRPPGIPKDREPQFLRYPEDNSLHISWDYGKTWTRVQ